MESRCLKQCTQVLRGARRRKLSPRTIISRSNANLHASRSFTTTTTRKADNETQSQSKPTSNRPAPAQTQASTQRRNGRIDLSSIPGMPSSYRPPQRPDEATAQAKLRSLLDPVNTNPKPRQGGLDAYTTTRKPLDIMGLIADWNKPYKKPEPEVELDEPGEVLRLRPTLGRTVNVTPATGFDLTRAFRSLEIKCNVNSVRKDEIKQRFHVRRGQRRKLERSARWRVLFKEGFLAECARIRRMRAQGW